MKSRATTPLQIAVVRDRPLNYGPDLWVESGPARRRSDQLPCERQTFRAAWEPGTAPEVDAATWGDYFLG